ncbi:O-antigen polymerase [Colwellia sp. 75C3]|uniref:O-antigen ligase family protein n=1 Tax=Colwellia sp. 75C3 TaxID=888425 RepID=UPI000C3367D4|nr:O-antigen ligase family protein [Colwellia sp. 75C3]PKG81312.1 O-antigen polymerase [Colwellia sp. 75C3]
MRDVVVLIIILLFLIIAFRDSLGGMIAYWWFAIFRPQDWVYMDITGFRFPMIATILFFIPSMFRGKYPTLKDGIAILMVTWYLLMVLSANINGCSDLFQKIEPLQYMFLLMFAVLLSASVIENKQHLLYLIAIVGLSLGFYSGKAGIQAILAGGTSTYGASNLEGIFSGSNAFAMGSGILLFFLIFIYQQCSNCNSKGLFPKYIILHPKLFSIVMLLFIIGTIFNIISLSSRGSALATFLALVLLFVLNGKWFKKAFLMIPILAITITIIPLPEGYEQRIESAFAEKEELDASAASRPHFWKVATKMTQSYPLGVGPGCFREYYDFFDDSNGKYRRARDVHSSHFQVLAESGYLGIFTWGLLFVFTYLRLFKLRRIVKANEKNLDNPIFYTQLCNAIICSITVYLIGGSLYSLAFNDLIWLNFGITIVLTKLINKEVTSIPTNGKESRIG